GPGGKGILPAAYEGYSGESWSALAGASPLTAGYMTVLYRMYGVYCAVFGLMGSAIAVTAFRRGERWAWGALLAGNTVALVAAMTMDKVVNAIGPFEVTEYLGLVLVWGGVRHHRSIRRCERNGSINDVTSFDTYPLCIWVWFISGSKSEGF